jgi:RNA polymerase sigma-32 factor
MRNVLQHLRNCATKRCAICDGKFGLIRYYTCRTSVCSKKCASRPARRATADGYADLKSPDKQLQNQEGQLFVDASFSGGVDMNGTRTEYFLQTNPGSFPDRGQLASIRERPGASYLDSVRRCSTLERDQEHKLAKRWREHGDRDAAHQLVTSHLGLVAKIARSYRGYGMPISEIISEGNIGLLQALNRFEPEKGFRFAKYAILWIRASIRNYILRSWSLVKIGTTGNHKKLFFKLRSAQLKISAFESGDDLPPDQVTLIAKSLNVTERDVVDMNRRLGGDTSLNAPLSEDGEPDEWPNDLVDQSPSPEAFVADQDEKDCQHKALAGAIDLLNDRERRIFEARHLTDEPLRLEDLALEFNVSLERIRQIEMCAFEKVRKAVKKSVAKPQTNPAFSLRIHGSPRSPSSHFSVVGESKIVGHAHRSDSRGGRRQVEHLPLLTLPNGIGSTNAPSQADRYALRANIDTEVAMGFTDVR